MRVRLGFLSWLVVMAAVLAGCGSGGTTISSGIPNGSATSSPAAPSSGTSPAAPSSGTSPSPAGSSVPSAGGSTGPPAQPTPTTAAGNGAGSGGSTGTSSLPPPTAPPDASGYTNAVPAAPAGMMCRAGKTYNIGVTSEPTNISATGTTEVFTVFEPTPMCGGQTYPLILNGSGFGSPRTSAPGSFPQFTNAGYGVISADEAGEGGDDGKIRIMDPDEEGRMLLAVMDWAQAKLTWLAYGPTLDGTDSHEPIYGSDGGSYGGESQMAMLNVDKRHRLRAIAPQITPFDLNFALFQGGIPKSLWNAFLFPLGNTTGHGAQRLNYDPFVDGVFVRDLSTGEEDPLARDFFSYHSPGYFCNGQSIATNGDATNPGNYPQLPATTRPPKVNALLYIGVRDTLYNFNNGYHNYKCLQRAGGDVRLLSYQTGHNSLGVVPDPYVTLYYPRNDDEDTRCGSALKQADAELDFFDAYLKGQTAALAPIPKQPCISLNDGDAITVSNVPQISDPTTTSEFTTFPVSLSVTSGLLDVIQTQTLYIAPPGGAIVAGIPHIDLALSEVTPLPNAFPDAFIGLCVNHASTPGNDLLGNEVTPLHGVGTYDQDIIGVGVRLLAGDKLDFCAQGLNDQYAATGPINPNKPTVEPIELQGSVSIPILPSQPTI